MFNIFQKIKKNKKAFSLVEVLIVMFIAVIAFTSFYTVSTVGTRYIIDSKNRLAATALLNERMEIVRNLAYDKVGTDGNAEVSGNLPLDEDVTANGHGYHVRINVRYEDDATDDEYPVDVIPNDYKTVEVIVSWNDSNGQSQSVYSTSRFVPPGLETTSGGAPLSINVSGDDGQPVAQATVHLTNSSPFINDTFQTDSSGHIMLPAALIQNNGHLTITKSGYETIETSDATTTFMPVYGHINVVSGFLNTYNYLQNELANLTVRTADYQNNSVGNISFSIEGGKILGHTNLNVAVFSTPLVTETTDVSSGEKTYNDVSPGNYTISMNPTEQNGYSFIDYDPALSPEPLAPGSNTTYTIRVASTTTTALLLKIKNTDATPVAVAGARVTLTDSNSVAIFTEKLSSANGVVFYPDGATPLTSGDYTLNVEADGYSLETKTISIGSNVINNEEVNLVRIY